MNTPQFNQEKADAFAHQMIQILDGGALSLMTSVGHRTGLFDVMANTPPASSAQLAERAGLNERYVREWLGAMVTGKIIEFDPEKKTYHLPAEHAAYLTQAAGSNNIATEMQFVALLGQVEDKIIECFKKGGGVPYSHYPRFHEIMEQESYQTVVLALTDQILPLVPGLMDQLRDGIEVLDVGCGRGRALTLMAQRFPKSRFVGYDFSQEAIALANQKAKELSLTNLSFQARDVTNLKETERFHLITAFDAIHDQAQPRKVLEGIQRSLYPQGIFLMQDIIGTSHLEQDALHPLSPFLYTISCMHCMTVSLALEGEGLGTMWGQEKATQMLKEAGFRSVGVHSLPHDIVNLYYVCKK